VIEPKLFYDLLLGSYLETHEVLILCHGSRAFLTAVSATFVIHLSSSYIVYEIILCLTNMDVILLICIVRGEIYYECCLSKIK